MESRLFGGERAVLRRGEGVVCWMLLLRFLLYFCQVGEQLTTTSGTVISLSFDFSVRVLAGGTRWEVHMKNTLLAEVLAFIHGVHGALPST